MPRPERLRRREQAAAEPATETVDNAPALDASLSPQGQSVQDEPVIHSIAKRAGWKPLEDWTAAGRDPTRHESAESFLSRTADEAAKLQERAKDLEDRLRRTGQAAQDAVEERLRFERSEGEREAREAIAAGDTERADKAITKMARAVPDPLVAAFIQRNPWYSTDPDAASFAAAVTARNAHLPVAEQLRIAEEAVRKRFPEHFSDPVQTNGDARPRTEHRLSERGAPVVEGGARAPVQRTDRPKGWNDIPSADRSSVTRLLASSVRRYGEDEAHRRYAANYWREKDQ